MTMIPNAPLGFPGTTGTSGGLVQPQQPQQPPQPPTTTPYPGLPITPLPPGSIKPDKIRGKTLRYPYEALTDETDYLKIDIRDYVPSKRLSNSLTANGSTRTNTKFNNNPQQNQAINLAISKTIPSNLTTAKLEMGKGTILLPMPSNIQDGNSVTYSKGNLDGLTSSVYGNIVGSVKPKAPANIKNPLNDVLSKLTTSAGNVATNMFQGGNAKAFRDVITSDIFAQAANIPVGGSLTRDAIFGRTTGQILNQNVELLFNGVTLRSFKFSFKMTPRNENEALQIKLIINTFKQNMSPQLGWSGDSPSPNLYLETPNVFELTYMQGGGPHPFLHSFKQCVLTDMSVNYTGEGVYATYAGKQGSPVSMVLELGFKELEPIYDDDYNDPESIGVGY